MPGATDRPQRRLILAVLILGISAITLITLIFPHGIKSTLDLTDHRLPNLDSTLAHRSDDVSTLDLSSCDPDTPCTADQCCGASGQCGYGPEHCGQGCLSKCEATPECGKFANPPDKQCSLNACCSGAGFCGTSADHCTGTCQSNCVESLESTSSDGDQVWIRSLNGSIKALQPSWSGENNWHCSIKEDCQDTSLPLVCDPGFVPIGWRKDLCPFVDNEWGKPICCPLDSYPRNCMWRGGSTGTNPCNGQCYAGEIQLFDSNWGGGWGAEADPAECRGGRMAFCCQSDHWNDLVNQCQWSSCDEICPEGKESIQSAFNPHCTTETSKVQFCCPVEKKFESCGWAGSSNCDDNFCIEGQIQVWQDLYGDTAGECPWPRLKALCCAIPAEAPYSPFDPDTVFEEPPSPTNYIHYHLQILDEGYSGGTGNMSTVGAFGLLVIEGPSSVVTSAKRKRDGADSDLHFLECSRSDGEKNWKARFVCLADDHDHDCHDMLEGGLEGTIIEMPKGCGNKTHAIARTLDIAADQTLPPELHNILNETVMEMTFDYNFKQIKRDDGTVRFRIDYTNMAGYWDYAIAATPTSQLSARYAGTITQWTQQLALIRQRNGKQGTSRVLPLLGTLFSQVLDCGSGIFAYAKAQLSGWYETDVTVALMMQGTLSPNFEIEEPFIYLRSNSEFSAGTNNYINGALTLDTLRVPYLSDAYNVFNEVGFLNIETVTQVDVEVGANITMRGNYSVYTHAFTTADLEQAFPRGVLPATGQSELEPFELPFSGGLDELTTSGYFNTFFYAITAVRVTLDEPGTDVQQVIAYAQAYFTPFFGLSANDAGSYKVSLGVSEAQSLLTYDDGVGGSIPPLGDEENSPHYVGNRPGLFTIASGKAGSAPNPNNPGPPGQPIQSNGDSPLKVLACPITGKSKCEKRDMHCNIDLCADPLDTTMCNDEDNRDNVESGDQSGVNVLARRTYPVDLGDNQYFGIQSLDAPSVSNLFVNDGGRVLRADFEYAEDDDCTSTAITPIAIDDVTTYDFGRKVTEHIMELQTISRFLKCVTTGVLSSGDPLSVAVIPAAWFRQYWNAYSIPVILDPIWPSNNSPQKPNDRVFEALGSFGSRQNFVVTSSEINGVKARLWKKAAPRAENKFRESVIDWLWECDDAGKFLKYLKATRAVWSYLGDDAVNYRLSASNNAVREQLYLIETNVLGAPNLSLAWNEFIEDFLRDIAEFARVWMEERIDDALYLIESAENADDEPTAKNIPDVKLVLAKLRQKAGGIDPLDATNE